MSTLLSTARVMDDQVFKWRVMGACLQIASKFSEMEEGAERNYALRVLSHPHDVDQMMLSIVASNPVISAAITVDEHGTVTANDVKDDDITYVVTQTWPIIAEKYYPKPVPVETPEATE